MTPYELEQQKIDELSGGRGFAALTQTQKDSLYGEYKAPVFGVSQPKEISAISSSAGKTEIQKAGEKLQSFAQKPKEEPVAPETKKPETIPSGIKGEDVLASGGDLGGYVKQQDGTYLPKTEKTQNEIDLENANLELTKREGELNSIKSKFDSLLIPDDEVSAQIQGIKNEWDARINEMRTANESRARALETTGLRGGAQFTGGLKGGVFGSILSEEERQASSRISDLEARKNAAILAAKEAQRTNNYKVYVQQADNIEKLYAQQLEEVKALQKAQIDEEKKRKEKVKQEDKDFYDRVTKPIQDLATDAKKNGASNEVISAIMNSGSIDEALQNSGDFLAKTNTATGVLGEYLYAKNKEGYTGNFIQYQNEDANRKVRVASASQNPDRILSATEAQALGVPFGTMASQAYGKSVNKPPTEGQLKAAGYATRMETSIPIIDNLESTISKMSPTYFASQSLLENTTIGNAFVDDEIKQLRQAERDFATAKLRPESGASISPTEFETLIKQYFPRPGDDAKTLSQKKQARQNALSGIIKESGTAYGGENSTPSIASLDSEIEKLAQTKLKTFYDSNEDKKVIIDQMITDGIPYSKIIKTFNLQ